MAHWLTRWDTRTGGSIRARTFENRGAQHPPQQHCGVLAVGGFPQDTKTGLILVKLRAIFGRELGVKARWRLETWDQWKGELQLDRGTSVHRGDLVQGWEEDCAALWNDAGDEANLCAQEKQAVSLGVHSLFILSQNVSCVQVLVKALKAFCKIPM